MTFDADIRKFERKVEKQLESMATRSFNDVSDMIIARTPVDTGRTKANWNVSKGTPDLSVTNETSRTKKVININIGDVAYFTNSVNHILVLEQGTSNTRAQPMVIQAVDSWKNIVSKNTKGIL